MSELMLNEKYISLALTSITFFLASVEYHIKNHQCFVTILIDDIRIHEFDGADDTQTYTNSFK